MARKALPYSEISLFSNISPEDLKVMLHCLEGHTRSFSKGEIIIMEQEKVQYVGIVLSGTVHMLKEDIWGSHSLLAYMNEGDMFGEIFAVQKEASAHATFLAATAAEILFLSTEHIVHNCPKHCACHYRITQNMFDLIGKKSVSLMEKIEVTSKGSLREKILAYLSLEAQKQGTRYLEIPLSRTDLAVYLGSNRSAMTRELRNMREEGLIDFDRNTFVLKK